jgi:hypothetical protein
MNKRWLVRTVGNRERHRSASRWAESGDRAAARQAVAALRAHAAARCYLRGREIVPGRHWAVRHSTGTTSNGEQRTG